MLNPRRWASSFPVEEMSVPASSLHPTRLVSYGDMAQRLTAARGFLDKASLSFAEKALYGNCTTPHELRPSRLAVDVATWDRYPLYDSAHRGYTQHYEELFSAKQRSHAWTDGFVSSNPTRAFADSLLRQSASDQVWPFPVTVHGPRVPERKDYPLCVSFFMTPNDTTFSLDVGDAALNDRLADLFPCRVQRGVDFWRSSQGLSTGDVMLSYYAFPGHLIAATPDAAVHSVGALGALPMHISPPDALAAVKNGTIDMDLPRIVRLDFSNLNPQDLMFDGHLSSDTSASSPSLSASTLALTIANHLVKSGVVSPEDAAHRPVIVELTSASSAALPVESLALLASDPALTSLNITLLAPYTSSQALYLSNIQRDGARSIADAFQHELASDSGASYDYAFDISSDDLSSKKDYHVPASASRIPVAEHSSRRAKTVRPLIAQDNLPAATLQKLQSHDALHPTDHTFKVSYPETTSFPSRTLKNVLRASNVPIAGYFFLPVPSTGNSLLFDAPTSLSSSSSSPSSNVVVNINFESDPDAQPLLSSSSLAAAIEAAHASAHARIRERRLDLIRTIARPLGTHSVYPAAQLHKAVRLTLADSADVSAATDAVKLNNAIRELYHAAPPSAFRPKSTPTWADRHRARRSVLARARAPFFDDVLALSSNASTLWSASPRPITTIDTSDPPSQIHLLHDEHPLQAAIRAYSARVRHDIVPVHRDAPPDWLVRQVSLDSVFQKKKHKMRKQKRRQRRRKAKQARRG